MCESLILYIIYINYTQNQAHVILLMNHMIVPHFIFVVVVAARFSFKY